MVGGGTAATWQIGSWGTTKVLASRRQEQAPHRSGGQLAVLKLTDEGHLIGEHLEVDDH